jgi:hypothetical protein
MKYGALSYFVLQMLGSFGLHHIAIHSSHTFLWSSLATINLVSTVICVLILFGAIKNDKALQAFQESVNLSKGRKGGA